MQTEICRTDQPNALRMAVDILHKGHLVAFPTDTVYGVGVIAFDAQAIEQLYLAKVRQPDKAIPILIGDMQDLSRLTKQMNKTACALAKRFWPGALTIVVEKHPDLPHNLTPDETIGVRMPDHPFTLSLLKAAGPLAVTSANLSGSASSTTAEQVFAQLEGRIDLLLDGGETPGGMPSTVVDCTGVKPKILRHGPITELDICQAIKDIK